jgi:hypothetical protein
VYSTIFRVRDPIRAPPRSLFGLRDPFLIPSLAWIFPSFLSRNFRRGVKKLPNPLPTLTFDPCAPGVMADHSTLGNF